MFDIIGCGGIEYKRLWNMLFGRLGVEHGRNDKGNLPIFAMLVSWCCKQN